MPRKKFWRSLAPTLVMVLALAGCESSLPSQQMPDLTYSHLQPLAFQVGSVVVAQEYKAPLVKPNVDHLFPVSPADALGRWLSDRVTSAGGPGDVRLIITDASVMETTLARKKGLSGAFTKEQSERYEARISATLEIRDSAANRLGFARTSVKRSITVREDANVNQREQAWFNLTEAVMNDFNREMEKNIRRHLGKWLK